MDMGQNKWNPSKLDVNYWSSTWRFPKVGSPPIHTKSDYLSIETHSDSGFPMSRTPQIYGGVSTVLKWQMILKICYRHVISWCSSSQNHPQLHTYVNMLNQTWATQNTPIPSYKILVGWRRHPLLWVVRFPSKWASISPNKVTNQPGCFSNATAELLPLHPCCTSHVPIVEVESPTAETCWTHLMVHIYIYIYIWYPLFSL